MIFYAIQTTLTPKEIHDKLGFTPWEEVITNQFKEDQQQVYMMSIKRIDDKNLDEYTFKELSDEIARRLGEHEEWVQK